MRRLQFVLLPALVVLAFSCNGILGFLTAVGIAQGESAGRAEYVANCGSCHGRRSYRRILVTEGIRRQRVELAM